MESMDTPSGTLATLSPSLPLLPLSLSLSPLSCSSLFFVLRVFRPPYIFKENITGHGRAPVGTGSARIAGRRSIAAADPGEVGGGLEQTKGRCSWKWCPFHALKNPGDLAIDIESCGPGGRWLDVGKF